MSTKVNSKQNTIHGILGFLRAYLSWLLKPTWAWYVLKLLISFYPNITILGVKISCVTCALQRENKKDANQTNGEPYD